MATIIIDGKTYEIPTGKNLLETCLTLGFDLPYFCWHPALGSVGACRQCAVKVYKDENDTRGRLAMSCMEAVAPNQRISVSDPEARAFREQVIEWLMTNHPHDCAVCDEGGSCHLQDMTVMTGHDYRRFRFKKRTHRNQYLGPFINHEMNRCIQCYRCVRFYKDYAGGDDLDVYASKGNVYFGREEDGILESEFSGNLAEVCPTGVFTDKTLKEHYTRKWDLTMSPSICQHCSIGCNTIAGERYGTLRMIANRFHGKVNGYFLCDRGRFGYEFVNADKRIRQASTGGSVVSQEQLFHHLIPALKQAKMIGIGSPRASLQSNFALKALVGGDNFYHGVSDNEHDLAELAIRILREGSVRTPSTREVEQADAVLILGEDITNTAPILALAVRQAVRQQPGKAADAVNIPAWHDAARRELAQQDKGPLFVTSVHTTKLDEVARDVYHAAPDDIARLGFAIAHRLDPTVPDATDLPEAVALLADRIAQALSAATRPVIISGACCESGCVMKAAANVAWALQKKNPTTGLVLTMLECNSLGLAMMGGHRLHAAFNAVINGHADTVIVMENDLYRHGKAEEVDAFLSKCRRVIVLDHLLHKTVSKANVIIPAGTFAESDGTLVNNEGRAQRFFQAYEPTDIIRESWRWLLTLGQQIENDRMATWQNFEDVTLAMDREEPLLHGVAAASPPSQFRIAGQRIARETHRYSGRTSQQANINVNEPRPPQDPDSPLSYTMEGFHGQPPSSLIPYFWAPGWNSVQSINKYQSEVGGSLRDDDPGVRLLEPKTEGTHAYFVGVPERFRPLEDHLWVVSLHHIFGSEELSAHAPSIAQRIPQSYVLLHPADAAALGVEAGGLLAFTIDSQSYRLPVKLSGALPAGIAGMPYGIEGVPYADLPEWAIVQRANQRQNLNDHSYAKRHA
jgi:NADH-quinone oxidoreductase subunit G